MNRTCTNLLRCPLMSAKLLRWHPVPSLRVVPAKHEDAEIIETKVLAAYGIHWQ